MQLQTLKQPLVRQVCGRSRPGAVMARRGGAVAERPVADAPQKGLQRPEVAEAHRDLMQKKAESDASVRRIWAQLVSCWMQKCAGICVAADAVEEAVLHAEPRSLQLYPLTITAAFRLVCRNPCATQ